MDWVQLVTLFLVLILSLTVHEAAHGLVAKLGGDPTAWNAGLVTSTRSRTCAASRSAWS